MQPSPDPRRRELTLACNLGMPDAAFRFRLQDILINVKGNVGKTTCRNTCVRTHTCVHTRRHTHTRVGQQSVTVAPVNRVASGFPLFVRLISVLWKGCAGGSHLSLVFIYCYSTGLLFSRGGVTGFRW